MLSFIYGAKLTLVFLLAAVILTVVACGSGPSDQDEQQVQLVYQDWRTELVPADGRRDNGKVP